MQRKKRYTASYSESSCRKINVKRVGIVVFITLLLITTVIFNLQRIKLLIKGYSFSEQNIILELDNIEEYLNYDEVINLTDYNTIKNMRNYLDYDKYAKMKQHQSIAEIITFIDTYKEQYYLALHDLGYSDLVVWELFSTARLEDLQYLVEERIQYKDSKAFIAVNNFKFEDLQQYINNTAMYSNPITNVIMTSYPAVDAHYPVTKTHQIVKPEDTLVLIKKGFTLPKDYVPKDLVTPNIPIAPDCEDAKLRKDASLALEKMATEAKKEGYYLALNSGYRSYDSQQEIYNEYFKKYDEVTAAGLVAVPGSSEHQTGLGVDLTSQSVIDKERLVFGDTKEYQWVLTNAYKYGFVIRYPKEQSDITGTVSEPWHLRYVGDEVAKIIHQKEMTLESYIMEYGFTYPLVVE